MAHKKKGAAPALTLKQQAFVHLKEMHEAGKGHSRHEDKLTGADKDRIYSFKSFNSYREYVNLFIDWLEVNHPEVTTMKKARKYAKEWLESLEGNYKAATIQSYAKGIGKYYGITSTDPDYYTPPVKHREDITRSRMRTKTDAHFSEKKNALLVSCCQCVGLRREGMEHMKPEDLYDTEMLESEKNRIEAIPEDDRTKKDVKLLECIAKIDVFENIPEYYIFTKEKGGKYRLAPLIGSEEEVNAFVEKIKSTAKGHRVWGRINKNCDVHSYRGEYAARVYRLYARPIDEIPYDSVNKGSGHKYQSDVYICRGDQAGKKYDKKAMQKCEIALGHETPHTFASHYAHLL